MIFKKLEAYLLGKGEFDDKEMLDLVEVIDSLTKLKKGVVEKLAEDGFEKSENFKLLNQKIKTVNLYKALQLSREEFDKFFEISKVKPKKGVKLDDEWYTISERKQLIRG